MLLMNASSIYMNVPAHVHMSDLVANVYPQLQSLRPPAKLT